MQPMSVARSGLPKRDALGQMLVKAISSLRGVLAHQAFLDCFQARYNLARPPAADRTLGTWMPRAATGYGRAEFLGSGRGIVI